MTSTEAPDRVHGGAVDVARRARDLAAGHVDASTVRSLRQEPLRRRRSAYSLARVRDADPAWQAAADLLELTGYRRPSARLNCPGLSFCRWGSALPSSSCSSSWS